jgi:uncharacterized coiled-coil protein SlyX
MPRKTNAQLIDEIAQLRALLAHLTRRIKEIEASLQASLDKDSK